MSDTRGTGVAELPSGGSARWIDGDYVIWRSTTRSGERLNGGRNDGSRPCLATIILFSRRNQGMQPIPPPLTMDAVIDSWRVLKRMAALSL